MCVGDDRVGFWWIFVKPLYFFKSVGVIRLYFEIVVVGFQTSFHEPYLKFGARHQGYWIARHHPFEVCGYIVSLNTCYVAESELLLPCHGLNRPFGPSIEIAGNAEIEMWISMPFIKHVSAFFVGPKISHDTCGFFLDPRRGVINPLKVAVCVERNYNRVVIAGTYRSAFYKRWYIGDLSDVTEYIIYP